MDTRTQFIGGNWDGVRVPETERNKKQKHVTTIDVNLYRQIASNENLMGVNVLTLVPPDTVVYIYCRFDGKLYYQRQCRNDEVGRVLQGEEDVIEAVRKYH